MTVYEEVKAYLEKVPQARERKNKNRAIGNLIAEKYGIYCEGYKISREIMSDIVAESNSYDRAWRKVLEDHVELRGSDYSKKSELELEKQRELGYKV